MQLKKAMQITRPFVEFSKEFEASAASNMHSRQLSFDHGGYVVTSDEIRIFPPCTFLGAQPTLYSMSKF